MRDSTQCARIRAKWHDKKRILRGYDTFATGYDGLYSEEQDKKYASVSPCFRSFKSPILDSGCGTGRLLDSPTINGKTAVGVDYSYLMLLQAKKRLRKRENIALVQADAEYLPFRDQVFGTVVSFSLLEDLSDWKNAITEMCRVAGNSSLLVISSLKKNFQYEAFLQHCKELNLAPVYAVDVKDIKDFVAVYTKKGVITSIRPNSFLEAKEHQHQSD